MWPPCNSRDSKKFASSRNPSLTPWADHTEWLSLFHDCKSDLEIPCHQQISLQETPKLDMREFVGNSFFFKKVVREFHEILKWVCYCQRGEPLLWVRALWTINWHTNQPLSLNEACRAVGLGWGLAPLFLDRLCDKLYLLRYTGMVCPTPWVDNKDIPCSFEYRLVENQPRTGPDRCSTDISFI